ncbi:hydrolase [Stakelama saccharophila]|uniref:Hydrolase n=1 Tax=Stakelama saccharophila TaxID=3075605 RepID=A0ABZ0B623_9SPHN|nr:hydrolase [Stakelama sp. W311]WNO52828.1 hydrolase [Stakelama sp. W311]
MTLSNHERTAMEVIAGERILADVERWVAVNSGTANLDGLTTMAGLLGDAFGALPGTLELVAPEPHEAVTPAGETVALDHGKHLHLTVRPEAPVQMLFTGHMDTVYPVDHPFQTATWLEDGSLNGPGAADMKGGLALLLAALKGVEATPLAERIGYEIVINSDEETGSFSSRALLERAARGKVAALTYEPALADGTLAGARGGTGNFSIVVHGKSAHAGRNPDDGRNAIVAAADIALRLMTAKAPTLSVNPAKIDGGGPNNVVPELAVLRVNFRPKAQEEINRAQAHIDATVAAVAKEHDVRIEVHGSFNRPPKPIDDAAERLFALVRQSGADLDIPVSWRDTGGVCDGNNIAACGVPVVDTMGARGGSIHSSEEFMIPESLQERARLSALTILRIAERGRP